MKAVGVSGHQRIPMPALQHINNKMSDALDEIGEPFVGYSSLADGADQLFARAVLDHGGRLFVVVPSSNYEVSFADSRILKNYQGLLAQAEGVETLPYAEPSEDAYLAAGHWIVDRSDVILAVWDGQPARGTGGTADIVEYARRLGKRVVVIWPSGVQRD